MTDLKTKLGRRIASLRKQKGLTQENLAELIDIATPSLGCIEVGKFYPQPENIEKIANALGVEVYDLFYFKDIENRDEILAEIKNDIDFIKNDSEKLLVLYNFIKLLL